MMKRLLICVVSLLLVLGISGPVSAGWVLDTSPDTVYEACDLAKAKLEIYPPTAAVPPFNPLDLLNLHIKMEDGSSLPGIVVLEVDVDHKDTTGGTLSMTGIPVDPCPCKTCPGFDITVQIVLRDQADTASNAWCYDCFGPIGRCMTKGDSCGTCQHDIYGPGECWKADETCHPGDPNCYFIGQGHCKNGCAGCYRMPDDCIIDPPNNPCNRGMRRGDWFASVMCDSRAPKVDWGRIEMPLPKEGGTGDGDECCYKLPYKRILQSAHDYIASRDPADPCHESKRGFKMADVQDLPKWQVSVWIDTATTDGDDFGDEPPHPSKFNISDWLPNDHCNKAGAQAGKDLCYGNIDDDLEVGSADVTAITSPLGIGRNTWNNPCPGCKSW